MLDFHENRENRSLILNETQCPYSECYIFSYGKRLHTVLNSCM
jgi:hypothetical protein